MNGRLFTSKICNPHTGEPSEAQKEVRTKLIQAIQAAKAITAEQLTNYKNEFKKQKKYVSLWGFIIAKSTPNSKRLPGNTSQITAKSTD